MNAGFEPELKPLSVNVANYDVIAVGTPMWWYTMAPAVKTFLHSQDFSGKIVVPYMTNGGWPGHVIKDMKAACPGANFGLRDADEIRLQRRPSGYAGNKYQHLGAERQGTAVMRNK